MKLVHPEITGQIFTGAKEHCELIIESPELFMRYVNELNNQVLGGEGGFVLSDNDKELSISKYADIIINPVEVNINDRKILSKLYIELEEVSQSEKHYMKTQRVLQVLRSYFADLEQSSSHILSITDDIDIVSIFKLLGIRFEEDTEDIVARIIQYIKIAAGLLKKKVIVFVNIRSYINDKQLGHLIEIACYEEIKILFIENVQRKSNEQTDTFIIDCDGCEI